MDKIGTEYEQMFASLLGLVGLFSGITGVLVFSWQKWGSRGVVQ